MVAHLPFPPERRQALIVLMGLVIAVLALVLLVDRFGPGGQTGPAPDFVARNALAANTLEKDFSSLARDAYLMAVAPSPERIDAVRLNMDEFEAALAEAEAVGGSGAYGGELMRLRESWPQLRALIEPRLTDIATLRDSERRAFVNALARFDDSMDATIETYRNGARADLEAAWSAPETEARQP